ncbi:MAG: 50S ribosomal protein L9 [Candidatus Doudnabacteria bacterium]
MQVVFIKELSGTGKKGEVKEFNDGYARNFLISKGYAVPATPQIISKIQNEKAQADAKKKKEAEQAQKLKDDFASRTFTLAVKVGDKGQIFGSVHEKDLIARIKEKMKLELEKNQIILPKIKELGEYEFGIKLTSGITAKSKIKLINENDSKK